MLFLFFWAPLGLIALMQVQWFRDMIPENYENYVVWACCALVGVHRLFNFEGFR